MAITSILKIDKIKANNNGQQRAAYEHNMRLGHVGENIDVSKTHLNKTLIDNSDGMAFNDYLAQQMKQIKKETHKKIRKDAVGLIEIKLGFSGIKSTDSPEERLEKEKWKEENLDKWVEKSEEFLKDSFGEENIIQAQLHMDEKTPHIHAMIIPKVEGRLNANHYLSGYKKTLATYHDKYYEYLKDIGGIQRGQQYSTSRGMGAQEYNRSITGALEHELPDTKEGESVEEYRERARNNFRHMNVLHNQIKLDMQTEINQLKGKIIELQMQTDEQQQQYEEELARFGKNEEERKKNSQKIKTIDYLNTAIENYPDKEFTAEMQENMNQLIDWGMRKEHQAEHHSGEWIQH